ncbi:MAG: PIN domain-containing protein [Magnetospirillum sp. WYHS-4]
MILVDTSVWVDHLRAGDAGLATLLGRGEVLTHPFVIGEIALGGLRHRHQVLDALGNLPQVCVATDREALHFIDRHKIHGLGVGYVDVHLLAAVKLTAEAALWTRDRNLLRVAARLDLAATLS